MKCNIGLGSHNSRDWERVLSADFSQPSAVPDWECVQATLAIGDLAEPLGFDGIWLPEHCGTPYGMTPNPIQALSYYAGRTERVNLGTFVVVAPWWHPVRLAHQIAYLDLLSNGRYTTIGIGRGVSKGEFEAVGVPREESRQRFNETLDILELALTQERFSYDGEIFTVPEMSLRPRPQSDDLFSRIYSSSSTPESLEILARRGMVPLFVGNKPIEDAGREVQKVNIFRKEQGLPPCQPKNVMFMYCTNNADDVAKTEEWIWTANRDVTVHYGFADASNFKGVKGYEAYAAREASATAVLASAVTGDAKPPAQKTPGYHASNLLIGTPDEVFNRLKAAQEACSFSEVTIVPQFGTMPYDEAMASTKLFAEEVLPAVHKMDAPLHAAALPENALA
jgi:alkanesulfonate monooxygenase SsuD/methylene tetrahydromethanopterin reductase-like flavin-dependent oxidoreductase (luciferase family)